MTYKQVRDVVSRVQHVHRLLSRVMSRLEHRASDERLRLLLEYISRHERNLDLCLREYERDGANGLLDTWLQYIPDDKIQLAFGEVRFDPDMSPEEIVAAAMTFDRALVDLYRHLAESTSIPRVQELFISLIELEQGKDQRYARTILDG